MERWRFNYKLPRNALRTRRRWYQDHVNVSFEILCKNAFLKGKKWNVGDAPTNTLAMGVGPPALLRLLQNAKMNVQCTKFLRMQQDMQVLSCYFCLNWTPIPDWCVMRWGSQNKYCKDTYLKETLYVFKFDQLLRTR